MCINVKIKKFPKTNPHEAVARPQDELDEEEVKQHAEPQVLVDHWLPHTFIQIIFNKFSEMFQETHVTSSQSKKLWN